MYTNRVNGARDTVDREGRPVLTRLLRADLARGAVVAATLTALVALAVTLMSAGTSLIVKRMKPNLGIDICFPKIIGLLEARRRRC